MTKSKVSPDKIHLQGVRILKSHFEVSGIDEQQEISTFSMGFKSESGFDINENQQLFRLYIKIKGLNDKEEYVGVSGEYHIEFYFYIENLTDFVHREEGAEENDFSISQELGATIAGIAYSTSRGIILDRTQATDFSGFLLPVINPNHLLLEDSFSDL